MSNVPIPASDRQRMSQNAATAGFTILLIAVAILAAIWIQSTKPVDALAGARFASFVGITVLTILYLLYRLSTGTWSLAALYEGSDHRPSTSKFQALIWTIVAIFAYSGIYALRASNRDYVAIDDIPINLMLAMGFTFTTLAAAKGITVSYLNSGRITKPEPTANEPTSVTREDGGEIDLTKAQMLAWTYIAVAVYVFHLFHFFNTWRPNTGEQFPDIDAALMVLMGLSQGVYVGKKLATADTPVLNLLGPASGPPGTPIRISGASFGSPQGLGILTLDTIAITPTGWNDTEIVFTLPDTHPTKNKWTMGQTIAIDVVVNGRSAVTPLQFTVLLPTIENVTKAATNVAINGSGFGTAAIPAAQRSVTIGGKPADIVSWANQQIVATIPTGVTGSVDIVVTVGGATATAKTTV